MSRFIGAEEHITFKLSWDVDIDTNDATAKVELPTPTRFDGQWTLNVEVKGPQALKFELNIFGAETGALGMNVVPYWRFSWSEDDPESTLCVHHHGLCRVFPPQVDDCFYASIGAKEMRVAAERNKAFRPLTHRRFRAEFTLVNMQAPPSLVHSLTPLHLASITKCEFAPLLAAHKLIGSSCSLSPLFST